MVWIFLVYAGEGKLGKSLGRDCIELGYPGCFSKLCQEHKDNAGRIFHRLMVTENGRLQNWPDDFHHHVYDVSILASKHRINYAKILRAARSDSAGSVASFLLEKLPFAWRKAYVKAAARPVNLVRFQVGTFAYICDLYSRLESTGEVAYDQTVADRVVVAYGTSCSAGEKRNASRTEDFPGSTEAFVAERDNGHFIAHCIGGGLDVNVFSQDRRLNRGRSAQGKIYRQMERYCHEQPGTFCFSRPMYADGSGIPRWLEFGLLKADQTLWVEIFDN